MASHLGLKLLKGDRKIDGNFPREILKLHKVGDISIPRIKRETFLLHVHSHFSSTQVPHQNSYDSIGTVLKFETIGKRRITTTRGEGIVYYDTTTPRRAVRTKESHITSYEQVENVESGK